MCVYPHRADQHPECGNRNDRAGEIFPRSAGEREGDVLQAVKSAASGPVQEGAVGAGTGTTAFSWKGGIGTSSRLVPRKDGTPYTIGVLLQSNFGGMLSINGVPFTREINQPGVESKTDGSCMIVVATDAPLSDRNLKRLAKRAFNGMARTTNFMANSSGDYAIAFSTAYRIPHNTGGKPVETPPLIANDDINPLFNAVEEAVQEAVYNSLFMATTVTGFQGKKAEAINLEDVVRIMKKYNMLDLGKRLKWFYYSCEAAIDTETEMVLSFLQSSNWMRQTSR